MLLKAKNALEVIRNQARAENSKQRTLNKSQSISGIISRVKSDAYLQIPKLANPPTDSERKMKSRYIPGKHFVDRDIEIGIDEFLNKNIKRIKRVSRKQEKPVYKSEKKTKQALGKIVAPAHLQTDTNDVMPNLRERHSED